MNIRQGRKGQFGQGTTQKSFSYQHCLPTGLEDCYEEDSSKYRGKVNQAVNGKTCLHWNSHILLKHPINAFMEDADSYGIGEHNFCRYYFEEANVKFCIKESTEDKLLMTSVN